MTLPNSLMSALEILEFVMATDCFPNVSVAYRILLTVPVIVASAERSFSKLKLLKNYLRSTISQERLNDLAMCTIGRAIFDTIDLNTVLDDFASRNPPRSIFLWELMDIIECKYKVIKLILEVRIYYCFRLYFPW